LKSFCGYDFTSIIPRIIARRCPSITRIAVPSTWWLGWLFTIRLRLRLLLIFVL
jgi:hypothetical protein